MAERMDWTRRRFLGTAVAGAAGTALLGACGLQKGASVDSSTRRDDVGWGQSIFLDPPLGKPDVTFEDVDGNPYPLIEKTEGRLTILAFGYTHCPDICPIYLQTLASARRTLRSGPGSRPIVLFVGIDRERDTHDQLRNFLAMDDSFIGLTGTEEAMRQATADLYLGDFQIGEPDEDGDYLVAHDGRLTVFSPEDDMAHRMYGPDTRQADWVRDLPRIDRGIYA